MRLELAQTLMADFADATGVSGETRPRRYLWTDAFAVCNFLGLYRQTGDELYLRYARELIDQVHHILGRHREDDSRRGWISGLSEEEGERHPTIGGLRIGKRLNEHGPLEEPDAFLEWEQDGQYFHYLTKWVHALYRAGRELREPLYQRWAAELAVSAQRAFTYEISPGGLKRMVWKMSIDLSRPLVPSMGQHDPLDGLIACLELQIDDPHEPGNDADVAPAVAELSKMCERSRLVTEDTLGIGGLLDAAARLAQMVFLRGIEYLRLLRQLFVAADLSLQAFDRRPLFSGFAERRLAFRELGLSIGIRGLEAIRGLVEPDRELTAIIVSLLQSQPLAAAIEDFWCDPAHRLTQTWLEHRDINTVMLATSLAPDGYLTL